MSNMLNFITCKKLIRGPSWTPVDPRGPSWTLVDPRGPSWKKFRVPHKLSAYSQQSI